MTLETKTINLTFDQFFDQFRPITNHLTTNGQFDNKMFETYDQELVYVQQADQRRVWTVLENDGKLSIAEGMHRVNRHGYFITAIPAADNTMYNIEDEEDEED